MVQENYLPFLVELFHVIFGLLLCIVISVLVELSKKQH
jgi:hypothetical protein